MEGLEGSSIVRKGPQPGLGTEHRAGRSLCPQVSIEPPCLPDRVTCVKGVQLHEYDEYVCVSILHPL